MSNDKRDPLSGNPDGYGAVLNAANGDNTLSVGLEFERHVRDGSSGAITVKHLFNESQAAALKVKVGPDTRGGFAQFIQGLGEDIDANGLVTATVGYLQFDRSGDFSGNLESDALDTYAAALRYTHTAKDTPYLDQGFFDLSYVNIQSDSHDYAAANGGWPDVRKWEVGVGGTLSFLNRGIAATPRAGMKWTQIRKTNGGVNDRDAFIGALKLDFGWKQLIKSLPYNVGRTSFSGERTSAGEWKAAFAHHYGKYYAEAGTDQTDAWYLRLGLGYDFPVPTVTSPESVRLNANGDAGQKGDGLGGSPGFGGGLDLGSLDFGPIETAVDDAVTQNAMATSTETATLAALTTSTITAAEITDNNIGNVNVGVATDGETVTTQLDVGKTYNKADLEDETNYNIRVDDAFALQKDLNPATEFTITFNPATKILTLTINGVGAIPIPYIGGFLQGDFTVLGGVSVFDANLN